MNILSQYLSSHYSKKYLYSSGSESQEFENEYYKDSFRKPTKEQLETYNRREKQAAFNILGFSTGKKIFLIDSDKTYSNLLSDCAKSRGISLKCFLSISDMGSIAVFNECDIAIVEASHGELSGIEIGEIFCGLFSGKPLIIISDDVRPSQDIRKNWPASIIHYFLKSYNPDKILDKALQAC